MTKWIKKSGGGALLLLVLAGLWRTSVSNYLLFHSIVEGFSIIIAYSIFVLAWNTRSFVENHYLLFLGLIYPFVGTLDFLHMTAYRGMGIFPNHGANLPTQLWIQARYMESASILAAALFLHRRLRTEAVLIVYSLATTLLLLSVFAFDLFPDCYVEPAGLTGFKKTSEFVICLLLAAGLALVVRNRGYFSRTMLHYVSGSIIATILSELSFTLYVDVYGLWNMVGHLLKIVSFYFLYKGLIEVGLRDPYSGLFRDLAKSREELFRAREELALKNEELESFVYAAGHDLRTPLTSAMGYTQVLMQNLAGIIDQGKMSMMEKVLASLKRMSQLIRDLQDFAHLAKRDNPEAPVDLISLLGEIREQKRGETEPLGARIEFPEQLPDLWMEPTRAYQLFTNLISNGLKFARDGIPSRIEMGIATAPPAGVPPTHRTFFVRDNGRGIPSAEQEKVFDLFYSTDTSPSRGSGAGLAIVRRIVQQTGGKIWIESAAGQGTTFFFTLPIARIDNPRDPRPTRGQRESKAA